MEDYKVRLSRSEFLMFIGFIKEEDNFISLIDKYIKGEIAMYRCYEQHIS